jgi:glycolate oxidase
MTRKYGKITIELISDLRRIVGEKHVRTDPDKLEAYAHDAVTGEKYCKAPDVVVLPRTPEEISQIVKLANREKVPLVPRGAGTGYAGGGVAFEGGVMISVERMNTILETDEENMVVVAEAGVLTGDVQEVANARGLLYAGDPSSGDSSFIGGNVATNAGGNKAVKYGTTRQQVTGLELVTPEGDIVTLGGKLRKDSTGYCLTQLIVGSEGTLGIITKVILKLVARPKKVVDLLAVFPSVESAIGVVPKIMHSGVLPVCVEFMDNRAVRSCQDFLKQTLPFSDNGYYIIVSLDGDNEEVLDEQCVRVGEICTENSAMEVFVADPAKIWKARKAFGEASRARSLIFSAEDIVVPPSKVPDVIRLVAEIGTKYGVFIHCVAHAGDGNVHADILKEDMAAEEWDEKLPQLQREIYRQVYALGGKLSGEHGIGYKRRALMEEMTNPVELKMMRAIKRAIDPNNIMNPGKIFKV